MNILKAQAELIKAKEHVTKAREAVFPDGCSCTESPCVDQELDGVITSLNRLIDHNNGFMELQDMIFGKEGAQ